MDIEKLIEKTLKSHRDVVENPDRRKMIADAVERREAMVSESGALAVWTPPESTGRSPKDTVMVRRQSSEKNIDWDSPNNIPISEETFDMLMSDALEFLSQKNRIYVLDRVLGADSRYAHPVRVISDRALTVLFANNMFRPVPEDIQRSIFADCTFTLVVAPYDKLEWKKYEGRLRKLPNGETANLTVAMDFDRKFGVIIGSAYCGSVKKMMFTVMNYCLPLSGILSLHCSANEGADGGSALLLGLSGTGKTTLSADPRRALLGDDEHGWSDDGIANFENGCYAKMINISPQKEPDIYDAVMHKDDYLNHGAIVENAMCYPSGKFDFNDARFTENSRASFPLTYLKKVKENSMSGHPKTILFLTADANGVIAPISKLTPEQAMFWFLMGYTSKLAGTETGVVEPTTTFSRFFGAPFMPLNPDIYAGMLGERMRKHNSKVYLVNTGWSGGPYGVGKRMDIDLTRAMVNAALEGELEKSEFVQDPIFKYWIPKTCPGVPSEMLFPRNTWQDKNAYDERARKLACEFASSFEKTYGKKGIAPNISAQCPGL